MLKSSKSFESIKILMDYFNFFNDLSMQEFKSLIQTENVLTKIKDVNFYTYSEKDETYIGKSDIKYDDEIVRCAYLMKYAVINSYSVTEHFQNVYNCDSILFNDMKEMNSVRICCFGGGSGIELFAICKVISNFLRSISTDEHQYTIKLCFTIIDICKEWENWIFSLVKKLRKCDNDVIDVHVRFIQANLTKKWGEDVEKAVRKADILTMVKFLSALYLDDDDYEKKRDLKLIQIVAHEMKLNSWIFFLDFAGGYFYKKMEERMKLYQYFQQVQSLLHKQHSFFKYDLQFSEACFSFMFEILPICSSTRVSSGTWQKCIPKLSIKQKKPNSVKKLTTDPKSLSVSKISKKLERRCTIK